MRNLFALPFWILLIAPNVLHAAELSPAKEKPNLIIFALVVFSAILLALAVHELGHLLTGLAQGFRFRLFVVGPLGIRRSENRIEVYLNKNFAMMGGVAATVPTSPSPENKKKFARLILAGPIASLAFGALFLALAPYGGTLWVWFFFIAGGSSIGLFAATTLPTRSGVYFTDRARFQRLISKGKAGESEEALLTIIAQSMMDNSHKNIPVEKALVLQQDDAPFMKFWGYYYEHAYYSENGNDERALETKSVLIKNKKLVSKEVWRMLKIDEGEPTTGQRR